MMVANWVFSLRTAAILSLALPLVFAESRYIVVYEGRPLYVPCPNVTALLYDKYINERYFHSHSCCSNGHCEDSNAGLEVIATKACNNTWMQCITSNPRVEGLRMFVQEQGVLAAIVNLTAKRGSDFIEITWDPPFSLNITEEGEHGIWYNILIEDITEEDNPVSVRNETTYDQYYNFTIAGPNSSNIFRSTVTSWNGAGEGMSVSVNASFLDLSLNQSGPTENGQNENTTEMTQTPKREKDEHDIIYAVVGGGLVIIIACGMLLLLGYCIYSRIKTKYNSCFKFPKQCQEDIDPNSLRECYEDVHPDSFTNTFADTVDEYITIPPEQKKELGNAVTETDPKESSEVVYPKGSRRSERVTNVDRSYFHHCDIDDIITEEKNDQQPFSSDNTPQISHASVEIELDSAIKCTQGQSNTSATTPL